MQQMKQVIQAAQKAGVRDKVKIMVGGAPVTEQFAQSIEADCYTDNAVSAAEEALRFCKAALDWAE